MMCHRMLDLHSELLATSPQSRQQKEIKKCALLPVVRAPAPAKHHKLKGEPVKNIADGAAMSKK